MKKQSPWWLAGRETAFPASGVLAVRCAGVCSFSVMGDSPQTADETVNSVNWALAAWMAKSLLIQLWGCPSLANIFWWWFPKKYSALEHGAQQLSLSSQFFGQGWQLRVAGSSAILSYAEGWLCPGHSFTVWRWSGVCASEFVPPSSPE